MEKILNNLVWITFCPSFICPCLYFPLYHSWYIYIYIWLLSISLTGNLKPLQYAYCSATAVNMTFWIWTSRDVLDSLLEMISHPQRGYPWYIFINNYAKSIGINMRYTDFLISLQTYRIFFRYQTQETSVIVLSVLWSLLQII